jgi:hypothetical protein
MFRGGVLLLSDQDWIQLELEARFNSWACDGVLPVTLAGAPLRQILLARRKQPRNNILADEGHCVFPLHP